MGDDIFANQCCCRAVHYWFFHKSMDINWKLSAHWQEIEKKKRWRYQNIILQHGWIEFGLDSMTRRWFENWIEIVIVSSHTVCCAFGVSFPRVYLYYLCVNDNRINHSNIWPLVNRFQFSVESIMRPVSIDLSVIVQNQYRRCLYAWNNIFVTIK